MTGSNNNLIIIIIFSFNIVKTYTLNLTQNTRYTSATQGSNDNTQTATQDSNEKSDTAHV